MALEPGRDLPLVVGLMSGTSLDGVDAAVLHTDGERIGAAGPSVTIPYDDALRRALRTLLDRAPTLAADDQALREAERALTRVHADAVRALGVRPDLIGFHGQTILHDPKRRRTWQIGDAAWLADRAGAPVVHDFRSADVAAGGEGAPLVPLFHAALLPDGVARPVAVLNIGGVANLTFVPAPGAGALLAGDTGPGNALLDDWAWRHIGVPCDRDGALARAGRADRDIVARLLADPFFRRPPPRSLDRQAFAGALDAVAHLTPEDGAATLVAFTVGAIVALPLPAMPARYLVCGGGRANPAIMAALASASGVAVEPADAIGWDGDALEAQAFAFLAARSVRGLPLSLPGTTGVPAPCRGGRLHGDRGELPRALRGDAQSTIRSV